MPASRRTPVLASVDRTVSLEAIADAHPGATLAVSAHSDRLDDGLERLIKDAKPCSSCGRSMLPDPSGLCRVCRTTPASAPEPPKEPAAPRAIATAGPVIDGCSTPGCGGSAMWKGLCRSCCDAARPVDASWATKPASVVVAKEPEKPHVEVVVVKAELEERTCDLASCAKTFKPWRKDQRFHSPECSKAHASTRARSPAKPVVHRDVKPDKAIAPASNGHGDFSDDPGFACLFALARLDVKERAWVLRVACEKWGVA